MMPTDNRHFLAWSDGNTGALSDLYNYGHKLDQVGIFRFHLNYLLDDITGYVAGTDGTIIGTVDDTHIARKNRWPHIKWYLTVRNDGREKVFRSLALNKNLPDDPGSPEGCRSVFLGELERLIDAYSWIDGIDIDLERGPNDLEDEVVTLAALIYNTVTTKGKKVHWCLPCRQSETFPYWEDWCDYGKMEPYFDSCAIMSYGFAWAGSAPSPISPLSWIGDIYDYAVTQIPPAKLFMGVAAYGHRWQIYDTPENLGVSYRGVSGSYMQFMNWIYGIYSHTDQYRGGAETQAYIPFAGFWDEANCCPYLFLHIYDYLDGYDADSSVDTQITRNTYGGKPYMTCYNRRQKATFTDVADFRSALHYTSKTDAMVANLTYGFLETHYCPGQDAALAEYEFYVPEAGSYDVAIEVVWLWWDKNRLEVRVAGGDYVVIGNEPIWWPYYRQKVWKKVGTFNLQAGANTLWISPGDVGVQFYGFRVCRTFTEEHTGGAAELTVRPQKFKDVNHADVWPYLNKFKITLEMLRRVPEYAAIWYDQWIGYITYGAEPKQFSIGDNGYYYVNNGRWKIWSRDSYDSDELTNQYDSYPEFWLHGEGIYGTPSSMMINYAQFIDIWVKAQFRVTQYIGGEAFTSSAGIRIKDWIVRLNYNTQRVEVLDLDYLLIVYYATGITCDTRTYVLEVRCRGTELLIWLDGSLIITTTISSGTGNFGLYTTHGIDCFIFQAGDAWRYDPMEALEITLPDQTTETVGRISRSGNGYSWDSEWGMFTLTSGEERDTREKSISTDYEFYHTAPFVVDPPGDRAIKIKLLDKGVWLTRIFLGDNDGFSIAYYSDADSILRIMQEAHNRKLFGAAMWQLGVEDPKLWGVLPNFADPK